jgi:hypothetical protein
MLAAPMASSTPAPARLVRRHRSVTMAALALIAIGCAIGVAVPAGAGWDFANFYDAGHRFATGQVADLYHQERPIAGQPPQGRMRFWSAPLSAALFAPMALLRPDVALIAFKLENVAVLSVALALLFWYARRFVADDPVEAAKFQALFAVLCLLYQPFWTVFRVGGQSTPTVFLMIVIALMCVVSSRLMTAALLLVGAAMIKPTLVILIAFLACVSGVGFAACILSAGAILGLVSLLLLGWPIHADFLRIAIEGGQLARGWQYNSSLYVPIENLRVLHPEIKSDPAATIALLVLAWGLRLAVVGLFVAIMRSRRHLAWPEAARRHFDLAMAICFWLLFSQTVWEHYLSLLFIPVIYCVAIGDRLPSSARRLLAAIFVASLGQNLVLIEFIWTHFEVQSVPALVGIGFFKSAPLLLALFLLWQHRTSLLRIYAATPTRRSGDPLKSAQWIPIV